MGRHHRRLLRRHFGGRIVQRGGLLRLVVHAERSAVENKGRDEQKPGQAKVSIGLSPSNNPSVFPDNRAIRQDSHH